MKLFKWEKGAALIFVFIVLITLSAIAFAFLTMVRDEITTSGAALADMQAFYIAEAGLAKARWALTEGEEAAGWGQEDISFGEGTYTLTTFDNGDDTYTITSDGYIPDDNNPVAKRRIVESDIPVTTELINFSSGAAASASSEQGANTADHANDGESSTKWKSAVNNGSWLKLAFGYSATLDRIIYTGNKIDSYTIECSEDDAVYQAVTNPVESPGGIVDFDAVSARYLMFNVNGNKPEVNELESYSIAGGASTILGRGEFITSW